MLVKKINPEWFPSESPFLQVGETIEITDPKSLILAGKVKAVGAMGEELSAFDLYGQVIESEMDDYKKFMEMRRQEAIQKALEDQKASLEEQLTKTATEVATNDTTKTASDAAAKAKAEKVARELAK